MGNPRQENLALRREDDLRFALDLGLCSRDSKGNLQIANPIYREIIPKVLASITIAFLTSIAPTWLDSVPSEARKF